ncbi:hypothetical protein FRC06_008054 [Ceratobasidium sp. 370]|nr:hypothetical protein FRC06_008054 [Ceratobasidium sp. 370]
MPPRLATGVVEEDAGATESTQSAALVLFIVPGAKKKMLVVQQQSSSSKAYACAYASLKQSSVVSGHKALISVPRDLVHGGNISASGPTSMWSTFPTDKADQEEHTTPGSDLVYEFTFRTDPSIPLHMQPHEIQLSELCQWDRHLPKVNNVEFTRLEHDTLLDRFFNYYALWLRGVVRELFLRDMLALLIPDHLRTTIPQPTRALNYTPFLHCAIMSVATAFSDNPAIRAKETREQFAASAKQHLESECERPTLTSVQALALLSDYHGGIGDRGLAYLFADKVMSLDYGRDFEIPLPHLNVNLPVVDQTLDQHPWTGDPSCPLESGKYQPNNGTLVFFETCRLMLIALRIMDAV